MNLIAHLKFKFEQQAFGICEWWGDRLKIPSSSIRLFFIYTTFIAIGSPIILYMIMGFWMKLKRLIGDKERINVWD